MCNCISITREIIYKAVYQIPLPYWIRNLEGGEIQPVHSKGDQPWVFFGRNDAKAETPVLWPLHAKSWLIGKDLDAGRDWEQEENGMTEDEMAGWHHRLHAYQFRWTLGVGDGQGGLVCCDSWGRKESTERLNWTELIVLTWICSCSCLLIKSQAETDAVLCPEWRISQG